MSPLERKIKIGDTGLEHLAKTTGKTSDSESGGAESGAVADEIGPIDPELQRIIEAWPRLSEAVKSAILTLLDAPAVQSPLEHQK